MNSVTSDDKEKTGKDVKRRFNLCLTCKRRCSVSGLCLRIWPGFPGTESKGVKK